MVKKIMSSLLVVCLLVASGSVVLQANAVSMNGTGVIQPRASDYISSWIPYIGATNYEADVTLIGNYSGTAYLALQKYVNNKWETVDYTSKSFSNTNNVYINKNFSKGSGTFRLYLKITINSTDYERWF